MSAKDMRKAIRVNGVAPNGPIYIIEGQAEHGIAAVHRVARLKGSDVSSTTTHRRILDGARTWADLCAPVSQTAKANSIANTAKREARRAREREECAAAMAAIDARKREMGQ